MNPFVCGVATYVKYCVVVSALALSRQPTKDILPHVLYEMEQVMAGEVFRREAAVLRLCRLKFGSRPPFLAELLVIENDAELRMRFATLSRGECDSHRSIL